MSWASTSYSIDESQAGKNLETPTKMERVAGIQTGGSERAFDLYMKARYLSEKHAGHGVVFASGTPISNSMVEMYTSAATSTPKAYGARGIEHFDGWAATFGEVVDTMEISPDGASLRPRSRFAKFVNLPELIQMFRAFADVQTAGHARPARPAAGRRQAPDGRLPDVGRAEGAAGRLWSKRYERLRNEKVDPREDNALAITTDGRKLALDGRMLQPGPDFPGSKINALVANVARIWKQTGADAGHADDLLRHGREPDALGLLGLRRDRRKAERKPASPAHQIAIMGDADTDAKKQALFEKVRQGTVRVLIGSTAKMGTGTNVQKRLVALHHLDAPWKPAEVEQREGRILRQGNTNEEVSIFRYVTEGSFDAYMWQALETKARFIAQVMSGDCAVRKAEDIGGQELSYAEVKAIASGNPAVLTLAETDAELQRLSILRKNHFDEQYLAKRNLRDLPDEIRRLTDRVNGLSADMATIAANEEVPLPGMETLTGRMKNLPEKVERMRRFPLGKAHGLEFGMVMHPMGGTDVYMEGVVTCREQMTREHPGPRAVLNAVGRILDDYEHERRSLTGRIAIKDGQLRDYEARLGTTFAHTEYQRELEALRDQLRVGLSEKPPEGGTPVAELADRIRELRERNTVEAAPERTGTRKAVRAERPVTARIRERAAERPAVIEAESPVVEVKPEPVSVPEPVVVEEPRVITLPEPVRPDYRQSVARRRQGNEAQLRLF